MPTVGVAAFPNENTDPLREWAERSYNGHYWTDMPQWAYRSIGIIR